MHMCKEPTMSERASGSFKEMNIQYGRVKMRK